MRLIYLILTITSFYACTNEITEPNVNGHWHLYHFSAKDTLTYLKLDIKNDTIGTLEGLNVIKIDEPTEFLTNVRNINEEKQTIMLWMEGMYERFKYVISGDTLYLRSSDMQIGFDFYGLKKSSNTCNFWDDTYSYRLVKIELEEVDIADEIIIKRASTSCDIYIGMDKVNGNPAIEVGAQIINMDELPLAFEQFKAKFHWNYQDSLYITIDKHKNIPLEFVEKLTTKLDAISTMEVYYRKVAENNEIVLTKQSL